MEQTGGKYLMVTGMKISVEKPFRRPICPDCNVKLDIRYQNRAVHSSSPEAKDYDFSTGGGHLLYRRDRVCDQLLYVPQM